jgi:hypothetical protein
MQLKHSQAAKTASCPQMKGITNRPNPIPGRHRNALVLTALAAIAITASVAASTAPAGASTLQHHAQAFAAGTFALTGPAHAETQALSGTSSMAALTNQVGTRTAGSSASSRTRAVNPDVCDFPGGYASALRQVPDGFAPYGGTTFPMPSGTTCGDLRIAYVKTTDHYEGWLQNLQSGEWSHCTKGWVLIKAGYQSHPPALCTDVKPTTPMAVASENGIHWFIIVED